MSAPGRSQARTPKRSALRWPRFGLREAGWALFVGAATLFANGAPFGNDALDAGVFTPLAYNVLQFGVPLVLLLQAANAWVDAHPPSIGRLLLAYGAAVLLTALIGVWVVARLLWPILGKEDWWGPINDRVLAAQVLSWHLLGVSVYVQRRYSLRSQQRLGKLLEAQQSQQRELAAARLLALQARVDPALLFERLQCIDGELRDKPAQARDRLAALIELLRALQPHHQARLSTLGREIEAVQAYAKLIGREARHTERLHLAPLDDWADQALAPLVLLPLLRPLLALPGTLWQLGPERAPGEGQLALRVQALGPDADATAHAAAQVDLAQLNERLRAVHGPGSGIALQPGTLPSFLLHWAPQTQTRT